MWIPCPARRRQNEGAKAERARSGLARTARLRRKKGIVERASVLALPSSALSARAAFVLTHNYNRERVCVCVFMMHVRAQHDDAAAMIPQTFHFYSKQARARINFVCARSHDYQKQTNTHTHTNNVYTTPAGTLYGSDIISSQQSVHPISVQYTFSFIDNYTGTHTNAQCAPVSHHRPERGAHDCRMGTQKNVGGWSASVCATFSPILIICIFSKDNR